MQRSALLILLLLCVGCTSTANRYELSEAEIDRAVRDLFECEECFSGELHHVVIIGDRALPVLAEYFRHPDRAVPPAYKDFLNQQHDAMVERFGAAGVLVSRDAYTKRHLGVFSGRVRARAAAAMDVIDSSSFSRADLRALRERRNVAEVVERWLSGSGRRGG